MTKRFAALLFSVLLTGYGTVARADDNATAAAPVASSSAPSAPSEPSEPSEPMSPPVASKRTAWPWIVMGTGVLLLGTALAFEIRAKSEDDGREADEIKLTALPQGDARRAPLQSSVASHSDSASSSRTAAIVLGTAGFLTVGGAVVWWFYEGRQSGSAKVRLTPAVHPGYAGAMLGGSF